MKRGVLYRFVVFLILNLTALSIGGIFTSDGVVSDWYQNLNKAPWTPEGWVFGAAWGIVMLTFSLYMAFAYEETEDKKGLVYLFIFQFLLNTSWNFFFFGLNNVALALVDISALTTVIYYLWIKYLRKMILQSSFILPYVVWISIALSLNTYIYIQN